MAERMWIPGRPSGPRPFVFVQLAPYTGPATIDQHTGLRNAAALLRTAQAEALELPAVQMASAVDWGDYLSPSGCIHPRWKAPIGERLALAVAALTYGSPAVSQGPRVSNVTALVRLEDGLIDLHVTFDRKVTLTPPIVKRPPLAGLVPAAATQGCEPAKHGADEVDCATFLVDGVKLDMRLVVNDASGGILLKVGSGSPPKSLSYLQANWPVAAVWAIDDGLPAAPFDVVPLVSYV